MLRVVCHGCGLVVHGEDLPDYVRCRCGQRNRSVPAYFVLGAGGRCGYCDQALDDHRQGLCRLR